VVAAIVVVALMVHLVLKRRERRRLAIEFSDMDEPGPSMSPDGGDATAGNGQAPSATNPQS
jgi:hypothetical protein